MNKVNEVGVREIDLPPELVVREATAADNDALIALELDSPLVMGGREETYNRAPDFFACHRHKPDYRVVMAEWEGHVVGVMTGVIQRPVIQGGACALMYVQQARVRTGFHGKRVAWAMANDLFAWAASRKAEGPYYLISPDNEPSLAFVERGGGRWPVDVSLLAINVSAGTEGDERNVGEIEMKDVVRLVNATHEGQDFFEPLTPDLLAARLGTGEGYCLRHMYGIFEGRSLVAVGGLWDRGATTERIELDRDTGVTTQSRTAAVVDWGWAPGREGAFSSLVRGLAARARTLGRTSLIICEPTPDGVPDPGLPVHRSSAALFTPATPPPPAESIRGLYVDLLYI
jgi:hypothetical protein